MYKYLLSDANTAVAVYRFTSMGVLFVWLGIAFYFMLQLEPTKKAEELA